MMEKISTPSSDGANADTRSASPMKAGDVTVTSEEASATAVADNGNVIDDGLQRGLKNRHLVSLS